MRLDGGYLRVPKARERQRGPLKNRLTSISSANWEKWENFEGFFFRGSSFGNSLTMSNLSANADVSLPRRRCENLSELRDRLRFSDAFLALFDTRAGAWNVSVLVCDVGIPETRVLIMEVSRAGVIDEENVLNVCGFAIREVAVRIAESWEEGISDVEGVLFEELLGFSPDC